MSEVTNNGRKKLVIILVAAIAVLALVLGLCIFFAGNQPAEPTDPTSGTSNNVPDPTDPPVKTGVWHCICGSQTEQHLTGCDGTEVQWTEWTATDALPITTGNYYLTADVTLLTADNVADVVGEQKICLDLNGHTINSETRVYRLNDKAAVSELTLLDSVGTGKVIMTKHPNGATLALVSYSNVLTVYGGTYDGSALTSMGENGNDAKKGGLLRGDGKGNTINIHGGTFIGVKASNSGGVLFAQNGSFNMTGGEMYGGHGLNGGNIHIRQTEVTITGGKIHNGVATGADNSRGGNIFINVSKVTISGTAEIYDGSATYLGENIFHNDGSTLEVTGGKVYMTDAEGVTGIYPVLPNPEDPNHMVCICGASGSKHKPGCDGTKYAWRPWTDTTNLPSASGKYYLAVDVKVKSTIDISGATDIYLDLNGHKVSSDTRIYVMIPSKVDNTLTILDSAGKGKVVMTKYTEGATFAAIGNTGNKKLVIYGGTFDASAIKAEANGGFVRIGSETSSMELHGGTIIGAAAAINGGAVHIASGAKFTMTGGEIKNGHANTGGNVVLNAGATFKMTGGKIHHGTANMVKTGDVPFGRGGNIFVNGGTVKISGSAQIYDGTVNHLGENIFYNSGSVVENKGKVYLTGSEYDGIYPIMAAEPDKNHMVCICGSSTSEHKPGCDGTKYAWSPWNLSNDLPAVSGKYYLNCDITLDATKEISGTEAIFIDLNGHTITTSARVYLAKENKSDFALIMLDSVGGGKVVATEGMTGNALLATIITDGDKVVTVYGGTYDASAVVTEKSGGIISAHNADCAVNIHGGEFIGAKHANKGGALYVENGTLNITGGEIHSGSANNGGNVFITNGTMTMSGGKLYNGTADASDGRGGNIFNNGNVTISGTAEIYDGVATSKGANVYNGDGCAFENTGSIYMNGNSSTGIYPEIIDVPDETVLGCICGSNSEIAADHKPGCDGTKHEWTYWDKTDSLPNTPGKYILYYGVTLTTHANVATSGDIYLDLNGQTIETNGCRVYNISSSGVSATVTILDSDGNGLIDLNYTASSGSLILLSNGTNHKFTMYGGTVDATNARIKNHGAVIRNMGHTVNIHGGVIIGGESYSSDKSGAAIHSTGAVVMTGGEIYGGKGVNGGNICIAEGSFKLTGGKIYDGVASGLGHNIYIADGVTFEYDPDGDAEVYLTASEFSGIYPDPNPPVHTSCICGSNSENPADHKPGCDGTQHNDWIAWLSTTTLPNTSGRYYLTAEVKVSATTAVEQADADIYIDLNGYNIIADTTNKKDYRLYSLASDYDASLTILDSKGGAVIDLNDLDYAACFVILHKNNKTFTMYGGTVDGSDVNSTNHGGLIRVIGQTANIHGGTIIGGTCTRHDAGIVNVSSNGVLNITGGTLKGGKAVNGGNIRIELGTLNMTGGEVLDGACDINGANIWISSSSVDNVTIAPEATVGFTDPAKTYTGIYPTEENTQYKVIHMLQNIENDEYGIELIVETKYGMAGFLTEAAVLADDSVDGFTPKTFEQATIAADGTTEVVIYYDRNSYNVTWLAQDGESVLATGPVKFGAALTAPEVPVITDYVFTGWSPEAPATMPAEDVTFTAQYIYGKLVYVTFNSNGGTPVAPQEIEENTVATAPTAPTKLYSTFAGWYTDAELTAAWDFTAPVADDMTLYAKWTDNVTWTEWTDGTTLPTTTGNYKLMVPVTVTSEISLLESAEIVIDLNGKTVTGSTTTDVYRFASPADTSVTLSIWDSTTTGAINLGACRLASLEQKSANSWMGTYTLNIQGGTINGGTFNTTNGGVFFISGKTSTVNISGGTIKGANMGTSVSGGVALVKVYGTLNMTGGTVYGGSALNGGNLLVQSDAKINISGGEIYGGTANSRGGNIFVSTDGICVINGTAIVRDGIAQGITSGSPDATYQKSSNIWVLAGQKLLSSQNPNVDYDPSVSNNVYMTADPTDSGIWRAS